MAEAKRKSITSEVIAQRTANRHHGIMLDTNALGPLLKEWRLRRRMSQLDLACEAGISARHLSFVETGRSHPSRRCCCGWRKGSPCPCANAMTC